LGPVSNRRLRQALLPKTFTEAVLWARLRKVSTLFDAPASNPQAVRDKTMASRALRASSGASCAAVPAFDRGHAGEARETTKKAADLSSSVRKPSFWSGQNGTPFNRCYSSSVCHYHGWLCRRHCLCARSATRDRTGNRSRSRQPPAYLVSWGISLGEASMNQHVPPPVPSVIPPPAVDVPRAQVDAITCMIEIIDEPYTGDDLADYHLRRNKCEAARVLLQLKTRMLKEVAWNSSRSGGRRR
jgi:hypothetical protein